MTTISSNRNQVEVPLTKEERLQIVRQYNSSMRYTDKLDSIVTATVYRVYNDMSYQDKKRLKDLDITQLHGFVKDSMHQVLVNEESIYNSLLRARQLDKLGKLNMQELKLKTYMKYKALIDYLGIDIHLSEKDLKSIVKQFVSLDAYYVGNRRPTSMILLDEENFSSIDTLVNYLKDFAKRPVSADHIFLVENPYNQVRELYVESQSPNAWMKLEDITMKIIKIFQLTDLVYADFDVELFLGYIDGVLSLES
ncbi:hypothetical protein [Bacillus toyonensis]|uniref:hypothetical protein n=1 Tax=Bacillus toyonensis TaxID=155322 RepID=UPI000BF5D32F|nr:hypothetical protein [Bacillus toyonensis]PGF05230.1 hypothetical protein COM61_02095 [Bacillus toyonensis]